MEKEFEVVKNMNTLKAMKDLEFIKFHEQTGTKITGLYSDEEFTCYYIDEEGKNAPLRRFKYNENDYEIKYIDGCFCPYVFKIIN
jgi:hypothetical protein